MSKIKMVVMMFPFNFQKKRFLLMMR